jgi:predicted phage terminase large subunit-like protein
MEKRRMSRVVEDLRYAFDIGRKSIVHFRQIFHPSVGEKKPAPFHYEWDKILREGKQHVAIEAFRESAKSQYVCREFPLYSLVYPSYDYNYIVFVLATQTKAGNKIKEVADEYLSDPVLSANLVKVHENSQKAFDVTVTDLDNNYIRVRIEGYGKGAAIRGLSSRDQRPKLVIIDDPQDVEDMQSDITLEHDWEWFLSDIKFLGQYTRIFMIANNLGEKCLIERVFANPEMLEFTTIKIPIMNDDGEMAWADKYTFEEIEKERNAYTAIGKLDIWYRERMCIALSPESQIFKKEYFKYYEPADIKKHKLHTYITMDLAISKKKSADYTAIMVVGVNADNHWFVLDCEFGRFDPGEQMDKLFRLVSKWNPKKVGIEKVGYQASLEFFLQKDMAERDIWFSIAPLKAEGKKEERIATMQPRFASGTVWFPKGAWYLVELEKELLSFTIEGNKALHDDLVDALAYIEQVAIAPRKTHEIKEIPIAGSL